MKNTTGLNPQQLRELANQIERESVPIKEGYLKEDLYHFSSHYESPPDWLTTKQEKDNHIQKYIERFELAIPKGTKFFCYFIDLTECWCDTINYGVEDQNKEWASKYLENIKDYHAP